MIVGTPAEVHAVEFVVERGVRRLLELLVQIGEIGQLRGVDLGQQPGIVEALRQVRGRGDHVVGRTAATLHGREHLVTRTGECGFDVRIVRLFERDGERV
jgi:hypothetical protein